MKGLERMDFESGKANKKRRRELGLSHLPEEGRGGVLPWRMAHDYVTNADAENFHPRMHIRADQGLLDELRLPYLLFPRSPSN